MTDEVLVEHDDGLVVITINRPQVRNAVNRAVSYGVCEAIDEMERAPTCGWPSSPAPAATSAPAWT